MTEACAIVLAAGAGRRAGGPKADVVLAGRRLVDRVVAIARAGGCAEVIAVVRPGIEVPSARTVENPDPDRGLGSSFALGLAGAATTAAACAIVLLVDMPGIQPDAVARLRSAVDPAGPRLWFASFAGQRSHPVRIDRELWPAVLARAQPDSGARGFAQAEPALVRMVDCDGLGDPADLDTAAQLRGWRDADTGRCP